jgi:hypothetical protein
MKTDYELYERKVWIYTRKNNINGIKNSNKRAVKGFHLDHKYSIYEGFKGRILPYIVGGIKNLEFIPYLLNASKGRKCSVLLEDIF